MRRREQRLAAPRGQGVVGPENLLKLGVGVMLSAFGVYWPGEA